MEIDEVPVQEVKRLEYDPSIRGGKQLVIQKNNGHIFEVHVSHVDIPRQLYMQLVIPSIYFILTLCVTLYLSRRKKTIPLVNLMIAFIFSVSLAYISSGASARGNHLGFLVNSACLILSLVLLLHFLKNYFRYLGVKWVFVENIKFLYVLPVVGIILRLIRFIQPKFTSIDSLLILSIFFLLLITILWVVLRSYFLYKLPQIKLLFIGLVVPFLPFLFLFVLPKVLIGQPFLNADIGALFLLLIPFNLMLHQLTERLFDIVYHITRLQYYFTISFFSTCWLAIGLFLLVDLSSFELFVSTLFIFVSIFLVLYIKEKLDYRERKVLFSSKGNHIHKLYQTIDKLGDVHRVEQILSHLVNEVANHLEVKAVSVITYEFETKEVKSTGDLVGSSIDIKSILSLNPGEIIKKGDFYIAFIHQDLNTKRWLAIGHYHMIRLKAEELLWLELLLTYTNTFIESTKVIEELMDELQTLQQSGLKEPIWLKKLLWLRVDDEKFKFAQEIHDTFLQEYLHTARQINLLMTEENQEVTQAKLTILHEQMIHSIDNLRAYCETLKPPLLTSLGLNAALERLAERTTERANFVLNTSFDRLYLEDEQLTLIIYRIVQELLNNAVKHSQASIVDLELYELDNGFGIVYQDNGVGCNLDGIWNSNSLGLQGIRERVEAFYGNLLIETEPEKGMYIKIDIIDGRDADDFSINNR
ncbi:sensor histidine kinase [Lysinibacillus sp. BW-2-10]|uniref:sensor histidine kinase n=1 Tax=Lysinibacillus sp. BW-2-10 TaxID=2590030 RepID=UPI0011812493|nr:ATP-binding protein [Lysinibacillus sp. BW-2-10]TSI05120.1 histidine kinase [Lysinibacillus sp. BW-2-10]